MISSEGIAKLQRALELRYAHLAKEHLTRFVENSNHGTNTVQFNGSCLNEYGGE